MYTYDAYQLCAVCFLTHSLIDSISARTLSPTALVSRLLKITGLFCKKALEKRRYSAKETYNFFVILRNLLIVATPYVSPTISDLEREEERHGVATVSRID